MVWAVCPCGGSIDCEDIDESVKAGDDWWHEECWERKTRCVHRLRYLGAKKIINKRLAAGWSAEDARVDRGNHIVCTRCWHTPE